MRRLIAATGLAAAALSAAGAHGSLRAADGNRRYVDPRGWSLVYPGAMRLERSAAEVRISLAEVTVASFAQRTAIHASVRRDGTTVRVAPPRDRHGNFPADGVAFRIYREEGGPLPDVEGPETRFPVRLARFRPSTAFSRTLPRSRELAVTANGSSYTAYAWIGPRASVARRQALARIAASLAFPRLRPGAVVGVAAFAVLQPSRRYPVGSFTRVRTQGRLVYLVRAPGGFYGIGGWRESLAGGYKAGCRFKLDPRRKEILCTNRRARWDRLGRVLVKPRGAKAGDPLSATVAKVAWDGHVLLSPGFGMRLSPARIRKLWPAWRG